MKTLVIHPDDRSTDFLCPIYKGIKDATVIRGGMTRADVDQEIIKHDRIIMMGHGSTGGLFSVGQFDQGYVISHGTVDLLWGKDNVFIWCNADRFVNEHQLTGFYSGMFISEVSEAELYNYDVEDKVVEESNNAFSEVVSKWINQPSDIIYKNVKKNYGKLITENVIAKFNHERLYFR
jgi:hypothetical protein